MLGWMIGWMRLMRGCAKSRKKMFVSIYLGTHLPHSKKVSENGDRTLFFQRHDVSWLLQHLHNLARHYHSSNVMIAAMKADI